MWQFPTEAERETVNSLIDGILSKAGPTTLVVTTSNLAEVIQEAKIAPLRMPPNRLSGRPSEPSMGCERQPGMLQSSS